MIGRVRVLVLAIGLDLLFGEPPDGLHPVVGMGRMVARLERSAPRVGAAAQMAYGAVTEAVCLATMMLPTWMLERVVRPTSLPGALLLAVALKPSFAIRALFDYHSAVVRALAKGDLPEARSAVGRIVSRDVSRLDEGGVAAAAIESLAENASDSIVAPLLFYLVFGLPAAYGYRMANTLDAMWGYRGRYEYLGKVAARVDDLLNIMPARLAALATVATCWITGGSPGRASGVALRDSSCTSSPNAGWPMATVAGALGLRLEKVDHYVLNREGRMPTAADLARSRWMVAVSLGGAVAASVAVARFLRR